MSFFNFRARSSPESHKRDGSLPFSARNHNVEQLDGAPAPWRNLHAYIWSLWLNKNIQQAASSGQNSIHLTERRLISLLVGREFAVVDVSWAGNVLRGGNNVLACVRVSPWVRWRHGDVQLTVILSSSASTSSFGVNSLGAPIWSVQIVENTFSTAAFAGEWWFVRATFEVVVPEVTDSQPEIGCTENEALCQRPDITLSAQLEVDDLNDELLPLVIVRWDNQQPVYRPIGFSKRKTRATANMAGPSRKD